MEEEVIVIDCGSESTRIGMAGDAAPALIDRTVLGKPKRRESIASDGKRGVFVGQDALQKHSILNLKHPVEKGLIVGETIVFQIALVDYSQFSPSLIRVILSFPFFRWQTGMVLNNSGLLISRN